MKLLHENDVSLPVVLLWGSFGGVCSATVYLLLQWIWDHFLPNAIWFSLYHDTQVILLFPLIFAMFGFLAEDLIGKEKKTSEIWIGIVSGISTALIFIIIITFHIIISESKTFPSNWLFFVVVTLVTSITMQIIGAWFHEPRYLSQIDEKNKMNQCSITSKICKYKIFFLTILMILLIPPFLLYFGICMGIIAEQPECCILLDSVDVSRTTPHSIHIVLDPHPVRTYNVTRDIRIIINDIDVSNQSVITEKGIQGTIEPPEGLTYQKSASVTITGDIVAGNETAPVHLIILVTYPDTSTGEIVCDREI